MKIAIKILGSVAAVLLSVAAFHAANAAERPPPSGTALRCDEACVPGTFNKCPAFCANPIAICNTNSHCEIPQ